MEAGEYLVIAGLELTDTGRAPAALWVGTRNGKGEGSGADAVRVDDSPLCDVDVTLSETEEIAAP